MPNYSIEDGHSNQITTGLNEHNAHQVAQRIANQRGESVWLYRDSEGAQAFESEEIRPTTVAAAEDSVSVYLQEFGPIVSWDEGWFREAYEIDTQSGGPCVGAQWIDYRDAARAAHKRSQCADLARDPREDETQWRSAESLQ